MLEIFTKIDDVKKEWDKIKAPIFLNINFLNVYYEKHPKLKHLFFMDTNMRLYAHIFKLTFNKSKNYLNNNFLASNFLKIISFDVLYLTNSFITNIPSFISDNKFNLNKLLERINFNYSLIVIPDFLFDNIIVEQNDYTKIEIESEMVLHIKSNWKTFEDYTGDLRKKYRNKVKKIINGTSDIKIKNLDSEFINNYALDLQCLFNQVVSSSQFIGPEFDASSFALFLKQDLMRVDGYFYNDRLVGFSSEMKKDKLLYSYFVGFDKKLNKSIPLYGRILIENINNAIKLNMRLLILGRTANEFKSNFGAIPIKSFVYLRLCNNFLRYILTPIFSKIVVKNWQQRRPFKIRKN